MKDKAIADLTERFGKGKEKGDFRAVREEQAEWRKKIIPTSYPEYADAEKYAEEAEKAYAEAVARLVERFDTEFNTDS